jgi:Lon protease-like protein
VSLEIPETAGVIILPSCTLFPHGALPLNIFETRYRAMLNDALEADYLFCVANLLGEETPAELASCVSPVGTIGLIRSSRELPDGRSSLLLHGVIRVHFLEWIQALPYPKARIAPLISKELPTLEAPLQISKLRHAVDRVLSHFDHEVRTRVEHLLDQAGQSETMVDAVAQQFVHDASLRQHLLEETDIAQRISLICEYLRNEMPGAN